MLPRLSPTAAAGSEWSPVPAGLLAAPAAVAAARICGLSSRSAFRARFASRLARAASFACRLASRRASRSSGSVGIPALTKASSTTCTASKCCLLHWMGLAPQVGSHVRRPISLAHTARAQCLVERPRLLSVSASAGCPRWLGRQPRASVRRACVRALQERRGARSLADGGRPAGRGRRAARNRSA